MNSMFECDSLKPEQASHKRQHVFILLAQVIDKDKPLTRCDQATSESMTNLAEHLNQIKRPLVQIRLLAHVDDPEFKLVTQLFRDGLSGPVKSPISTIRQQQDTRVALHARLGLSPPCNLERSRWRKLVIQLDDSPRAVWRASPYAKWSRQRTA